MTTMAACSYVPSRCMNPIPKSASRNFDAANENYSYFQSHIQAKKQPSLARSNNNVHQMQLAIDRHWDSLPKKAKLLLLSSLDGLDFYTLTKFWSSPTAIGYTRGQIAGGVCGASLFIAICYLKLGKTKEACVMTLNGSFLLQCISTPIEDLVRLCGKDFSSPISDAQVPLYGKGFLAARSPLTMERYLEDMLPSEYQHMMESFAKTQSRHVMEYVGEIGEDWGEASKRKHHRPSSKTSTGTQIELILVNDTDENERHSLAIGSTTSLKALFNDYAEKQGVSLRSLRFSYNGKTLFLSSIGNKTPEECNMLDQDVIIVHDTSAPQVASSSNQRNASKSKKAKTPKNSSKKAKGNRSKKKTDEQQVEHGVKTIEECKAQHSAILTKLHEEVQPQLKSIRMRLNALHIERQAPKQKKKSNKKTKRQVKENVNQLNLLPNSGVSGKAGKSHFVVQVGEVENLYKSTKPAQRSYCSSSLDALDLHGCTKEEALNKLDESLSVWVDTAMKGSYPFVTQAKIICGCGNQVLSEVVEKWIRENSRVANAPKNMV